jgi:hypothetical protein
MREIEPLSGRPHETPLGDPINGPFSHHRVCEPHRRPSSFAKNRFARCARNGHHRHHHHGSTAVARPAQLGLQLTLPPKTPNGWVQVVGRRQARILHGQDPVKNPEKFTPRVNLTRFAWPSNDEASAWAVANVSSRKRQKKLELNSTPAAAGSSSSPITEETASARASYAGTALPCQL